MRYLGYFGLILGGALTGSVVIETVFVWPGVGLLAIDALRSRDFQVVQSVVLFFAIIYIVANLFGPDEAPIRCWRPSWVRRVNRPSYFFQRSLVHGNDWRNYWRK